MFAGTSIAHIQKKGVGSAKKVFRRPLGKSSRPWLYGRSGVQTIAAVAVYDTNPSTMHDCDMLSELQTVGLAGSVSIAQPIIETTPTQAKGCTANSRIQTAFL